MPPKKAPKRNARGAGERPRWNDGRGRWEALAHLGHHPDGRRRRKLVTGKTSEACQAALDALKAKHAAGADLTTDRTTITGYAGPWLERMAVEDIAPRTLTNYRNVTDRYVLPHLGGRRLASITPDDVTDWVALLLREGLQPTEPKGPRRPASPATVSLARKVLGMMMRDAVASGVITSNPVRSSKGPKKVDSLKGRALTTVELRRLFAEIEPGSWLHTAVTVQLGTGLRPGEMAALTWDHVDLIASRISIAATLAPVPGGGVRLGPPKTRRSLRSVPLAPEVAEILDEWRSAQRSERLLWGPAWSTDPDFVVRVEAGRPLRVDTYRKALARAADAAGLGHVHPHDLRHTAATHMLTAGRSLFEVARLLGDTEAVVAHYYGHIIEAPTGSAAVLGGLVGGAQRKGA